MKKTQLLDILDVISSFKCLKFFGISISLNDKEEIKVYSMENIDEVKKNVNILYDSSLEHKHIDSVFIKRVSAGEDRDEILQSLKTDVCKKGGVDNV